MVVGRTSKKTHIVAEKYAAPLIGILKKNAYGAGLVNVEPDEDGKVRRIPAFIEYENVLRPHITVSAAITNYGHKLTPENVIPGEKIILDEDYVIPLEEDSSIIVNYTVKLGRKKSLETVRKYFIQEAF